MHSRNARRRSSISALSPSASTLKAPRSSGSKNQPIAPAVAEPGKHLVIGHAAGPSAELRPLDKLARLAPQHQIGFLEHVRGVVVVRQQHQNVGVQARLAVGQLLHVPLDPVWGAFIGHFSAKRGGTLHFWPILNTAPGDFITK